MKKTMMMFILLFSLTAIVIGQTQPAPTVRWFGQSCFLITSSQGKKLMIDPFGKLGYPPPAVEADLVLVTHEHFDHNNVGVVKGKPVVLHGLTSNGNDYNDIDQTVAGFHVKSFRSYHNAQKSARNTIFLIEFDGLRLAHLGDIGSPLEPDTLRAIEKVDVLMIPVGGFYTIGADDAWKDIGLIKPKIVIPMHYQTSRTSNLPIKSVDVFLAGHSSGVKMLSADTAPLVMPKTQEVWVFPVP